MKVLITGGTGFLGLHTVRLLVGRGYRVRVMGRQPDPAALPGGSEPFAADLRDQGTVVSACAGVEAVIHAAALSAPWGRRADFFAINVTGTMTLIAACKRQQVRRLVCVSTPAVHFNGRDHLNLRENAPLPRRYNNWYAYTKRIAEQLVAEATRSGLETVIIRPKALFGPGDRALLPRLIEAARRGRLPRIGDGHNLVDLTYVENVAYALALALESSQATGGVYTITNGEHVLLWELIGEVLRRLGIPDRLRPLPLPVALAAATLMEAAATITGREPLLTRYTATLLALNQTYDITAARRDLGYAPPITIAEGVERTLRHF